MKLKMKCVLMNLEATSEMILFTYKERFSLLYLEPMRLKRGVFVENLITCRKESILIK